MIFGYGRSCLFTWIHALVVRSCFVAIGRVNELKIVIWQESEFAWTCVFESTYPISNIRSGDLEYNVVDWDSCVEYVSFEGNPEDSTINITKCKEQKGYDLSHDCKDGMLDISKCMEGKIISMVFSVT